MVFLILIGILIVLAYMCQGIVTVQKLFDFDEYDLDPNPIWKIPVFIFWPIALAAVHIILLVSNYIDEIEAWRIRNKKDTEHSEES